MIKESSSSWQVSYKKPFSELLEAGFGSELEMECLCGLIQGHLDRLRQSDPQAKPSLFEIGTHRGAGICHFHAMAPELVIHSLNVLPEQLAFLPGQMASEIIAEKEIGRYARERGVAYTQHLADSRQFDWEGLSRERKFDIVFVDGCHEQLAVMADTLNALRILKPGGLIIWHDYKVIDEPGRQVFAAVNDLDEHEFAGQVRYIEGTWLAFAAWPVSTPTRQSSRMASPPQTLTDRIQEHLSHERRWIFAEKAKSLPDRRTVVFFSDPHRSDWPADVEMEATGGPYVATRDARQLRKADIVVFHLPQVPAWHQLPKRDGQIWVGFTMEPDALHPWQADVTRLATLDLLISYHAHADIRMSFACSATLDEMESAPPAKVLDKLVCAFSADSYSPSGRERLMERLERLLPVHRYESNHCNREAKLEILRRYHFCLVLEGALQNDYVTEQWYDCLAAGCVPVYFGAANIDEYSSGPGSFLNVRSFGPLDKLAAAMKQAAENPSCYREFFQWKKSLRPEFRKLIAEGSANVPLLEKIHRAIEGGA